MTRKDYVALAEAISRGSVEALWLVHNSSTPGKDRERMRLAAEETRRRIVEEVSTVLKADNGNFDRDRFEEASLPVENWGPDFRTGEE